MDLSEILGKMESTSKLPAAICMTFRRGLHCLLHVCYIMLFYKSLDFVRGKRKSVIILLLTVSKKKRV